MLGGVAGRHVGASVKNPLVLATVNKARWQPLTTISSSDKEVAQVKIDEEVKEANQRQDLVTIRKTDDRGWGIYARQSFTAGDLVMSATALKKSSVQGSHTIQTGWNSHVTMDLPARFVNHICGVATVGIKPNSKGAYDFLAIKEIEEGDEVLWDYECSEYEISGEFMCSCGSPVCRGQLLGWHKHGPQVMEAFGKEYIAPYLFTPKSVCQNPLI